MKSKKYFLIIIAVLALLMMKADLFCKSDTEYLVLYTNDNSGQVEPCG